jgi:hypothetical protein
MLDAPLQSRFQKQEQLTFLQRKSPWTNRKELSLNGLGSFTDTQFLHSPLHTNAKSD